MSHWSRIVRLCKPVKSIYMASHTNIIRCCGGLLTSLSLVVATEQVGHTALIAYDGFDYDEVGEHLLGKDGGFGFRAAWAPGSGIDRNTLMLAEESLSFTGLPTSGNRAQLSTTGGSHGLVRNLASPISASETKTVYSSFLIRPEHGELLPIGWGVVGFIGAGFSGTAPHAGFGDSGYGMGNFGGGGTVTSPVLLVMNQTSLIVVKAELKPRQDTFTFYVDPATGKSEPKPGVGIVKTDADLQGLGWLYIAGGGGAGFSVDEIRLGDKYSDVAPIRKLADFDNDNDVDGFDFLKWQLGESPNPLSTSDLAAWESDYGTASPIATSLTTVPEPSARIVLLIGIMAMLFRRDVVLS